MTEGTSRDTEKDARTIEFLRDVAGGEETIPHELQMKVEQHVRSEVGRRRTMGWKATLSISVAAAFVLAVWAGADLSTAYMGLLTASSMAYGIVVRKMIAGGA